MTAPLTPPAFESLKELVARLDDVEFWWPYVASILKRHGLTDVGREVVAGYNPTYPTFLYGDVVVKLFGHHASWRKSYLAERAAQTLVATDPEIATPRLVGAGELFETGAAAWPYLITSRLSGVASWRVDLSDEEQTSIAAALGTQVRRIHALAPAGVATEADWPAPDVMAAAARSSLPPHLVAQVDDYVARLGPFERVFTHGDLCAQHVFVEDGRFSGIIDWGDAMLTDRHLELIQIYRDMFRCDKALLRVFLDAYDWPVGDDFPLQTLGHALRRQAIGLAQHPTIDVFMPIAEKFPLQDIATLDELAAELFAM